MSVAATADAVPTAAPVRARRHVSFRAVFGLIVLLLMGGAAAFAPQIAPWDPGKQMLLKRLTCSPARTCVASTRMAWRAYTVISGC